MTLKAVSAFTEKVTYSLGLGRFIESSGRRGNRSPAKRPEGAAIISGSHVGFAV